jgi:hypothetical protein
MADPKSDDETEKIRQAGSTPEDGDQSTRPANWPGIPPADDADRMRRSAESGEGEVPDASGQRTELEQDLPSNRAQERGGP